jgi:hypothetical protein
MTLANLQGILHRGVRAYLEDLQQEADPLHPILLLEHLGEQVAESQAAQWLECILESVVRNYEEYKDYNATTTLSDYGRNLHVLLDFLRLKMEYERHSWHFLPIYQVHELLIRGKMLRPAREWESEFAQATASLADKLQKQLSQRESIHGVRLRTVRDAIDGRFLEPFHLNRLRGLVRPVVKEAGHGDSGPARGRFLRELERFAASPQGSGLDVPAWIGQLEAEITSVEAAGAAELPAPSRRTVSPEDLAGQLSIWQTSPW